ncbi:DUF1684 domain-containing protein [Pedobacter rhizosphaerae]|uniref:DUF1684 domain-containing protein n=1 Tax=Pedobacter rhizosphaerae TaxID=390241 RepID=A0A1H9P2L9_9SPHI|nr:DUF1684 domain-containing protein [Pedobacter rhizosphaerae]SER42361.1 hypothetical protein SAMN04488023_1096 [Pedobacter rhizosphaerae]
MKNFFILFLFISLGASAQDYQTKIAVHREAYKQDFVENGHSPLKENDLKDLHFFEPDSLYRVMAKVEVLKHEKVFKMPTVDGSSQEYYRYAKITFVLKGKDIQMTIFKSKVLSSNPKYKDHLFLPFTDESNGKESYGGGRYIDLDLKDMKDGVMEVDFNKAYNPYCAYSDGYRCPVPPAENDLSIAIKAGEKKYTGEKKHKS